MSDNYCAICSERIATTRDHVPPKALFPKPRPSNLITVPACAECNGGASVDDERFAVFIGVGVGIDTDQTRKLFDQRVMRSTRHNRQLYKRLVDCAEEVYLTSPSGIILERAFSIPWDTPTADRVQVRVAKGLYYHHTGKSLPNGVKTKVHFMNTLSDEMLGLANQMRGLSIGEDQFVYRYGTDDEGPISSIWFFQYYKRLWAGVTTYRERAAQPGDATDRASPDR